MAGFGIWRLVLLTGIAAVVLLLTASGLLLAQLPEDADSFEGVSQAHALDPPRPLDDVALTSGAGEAMTLADLRGQPALLFFGYTHCPDVCPTTLAGFRQVKEELGNAGDQVRFAFISADGSRDTPAVIESYVSQFDSDVIGLTGPEADVRRLGEDFDLYFTRSEPSGIGTGYLVDHRPTATSSTRATACGSSTLTGRRSTGSSQIFGPICSKARMATHGCHPRLPRIPIP